MTSRRRHRRNRNRNSTRSLKHKLIEASESPSPLTPGNVIIIKHPNHAKHKQVAAERKQESQNQNTIIHSIDIQNKANYSTRGHNHAKPLTSNSYAAIVNNTANHPKTSSKKILTNRSELLSRQSNMEDGSRNTQPFDCNSTEFETESDEPQVSEYSNPQQSVTVRQASQSPAQSSNIINTTQNIKLNRSRQKSNDANVKVDMSIGYLPPNEKKQSELQIAIQSKDARIKNLEEMLSQKSKELKKTKEKNQEFVQQTQKTIQDFSQQAALLRNELKQNKQYENELVSLKNKYQVSENENDVLRHKLNQCRSYMMAIRDIITNSTFMTPNDDNNNVQYNDIEQPNINNCGYIDSEFDSSDSESVCTQINQYPTAHCHLI